MVNEPATLYKLIILFMLDLVPFPLSKAQVSNFMLEKDYTSFLVLQQLLSELLDTGLLTEESRSSRTYLSITEEGRETLRYFEKNVNATVRSEIKAYLTENEIHIRNEISVLADYYKATSGEYEANLIAKDRDVKLIELTLSVPTKENAAAICDNWLDKNQQIYQYLIRQLF